MTVFEKAKEFSTRKEFIESREKAQKMEDARFLEMKEYILPRHVSRIFHVLKKAIILLTRLYSSRFLRISVTGSVRFIISPAASPICLSFSCSC